MANRNQVLPSRVNEPVYAANQIGSINEDNHVLLIKTDRNGGVEWREAYGGSLYFRAESVEQTNDGGYVIPADLPYERENQILLIKVDQAGNMQWNMTHQIRQSLFAAEPPRLLRQTSDGGYIIGGTASSGGKSTDFWVLETDWQGTMEWNKTYMISGMWSARSMIGTSDEGYLVVWELGSITKQHS